MKTFATLLAAAVLPGCAALLGPDLRVGQTEAEVVAMLGKPTGRYELGGGRTRLEFATGPFGLHTWMVDIDAASGRAVRHAQVLDETNFWAFQQRARGMTREQVLRELGRPGERTGAGLVGGELWSWRYPLTPLDCKLFQVQLDTAGIVVGAGYHIDFRCDVRAGQPADAPSRD